MSSVEAKYVAAVLWIKSQLADYDVLYDKVPIFCDNTSVIAISNNPVLHSRTKHIDIRYHFIRDHILKDDIELHFVPTNLELADIFTKPLAEPSFTRLVAELDSTSTQTTQQHRTSSKVTFSERMWQFILLSIMMYALLEHSNELYKPMLSFLSDCCINKALTLQPSAMYVEYLQEFWYTAEVEEETKTITFSLSWWDKPLSFTQNEFTSAIGPTTYYVRTVIPLPSLRRAVGRSWAGNLGSTLTKNKPTLSSTVHVVTPPQI
ncbi:hypothetical protein Tco_0671507 [Tanacetum coccineum]